MAAKTQTIETDDLIQLVQEQHEATVKAHKKTQDELDETKAALTELQQKVARRGGGGGADDEFKSVGAQIVDTKEFEEFKAGGMRGSMRLEIKTINTVVTSMVGGMVAPTIITDPITLPRRRMTVRGLVSPGQTDSNSVWYSKQTARQLSATTVAEGASKPKSDGTFAQVQTAVQTIAHLMDVSRQAMDDAPALRSTIDAEMTYGLALTEEQQLLYGDNTGSNLFGIVPQATAYSGAFAITGETAIDRILLAILQSELALIPATGIILNNTDWRKIQAIKDGMGRYLIGDPGGRTPPRLWDLDVVPTPVLTANSFLVGAFHFGAQIWDRLTTEILISSENNLNFEKNLLTVRAENRLAFGVKRPLGFVTGTLP
jgi:HK97 family phage major capsid protein